MSVIVDVGDTVVVVVIVVDVCKAKFTVVSLKLVPNVVAFNISTEPVDSTRSISSFRVTFLLMRSSASNGVDLVVVFASPIRLELVWFSYTVIGGDDFNGSTVGINVVGVEKTLVVDDCGIGVVAIVSDIVLEYNVVEFRD